MNNGFPGRQVVDRSVLWRRRCGRSIVQSGISRLALKPAGWRQYQNRRCSRWKAKLAVESAVNETTTTTMATTSATTCYKHENRFTFASSLLLFTVVVDAAVENSLPLAFQIGETARSKNALTAGAYVVESAEVVALDGEGIDVEAKIKTRSFFGKVQGSYGLTVVSADVLARVVPLFLSSLSCFAVVVNLSQRNVLF